MSAESFERYLYFHSFESDSDDLGSDPLPPQLKPDPGEDSPDDEPGIRELFESDSDSSSESSVRMLSALEVRNSLRKKLNRFLKVSQSCISEIEELHESQAEESVISVILQLVTEGLRHSERLAQGLVSVHSKKASNASIRATEERAKLEAEKTKLEDDKRRLEEEKTLFEAEAREAVAAAAEVRVKMERMESDCLCLICLTNPRNVVLLPCFHGQYCSTCIERHKMTKASCPSCRAVIQGTVPCIG